MIELQATPKEFWGSFALIKAHRVQLDFGRPVFKQMATNFVGFVYFRFEN